MADDAVENAGTEIGGGLVSQWVNVGRALAGQQRWDEAAEAFRRALAISPSDANILSNLAVVLLKSGRLAEAEQRAKQAFALDHSNAAICANLGACLLAQRKFAEAVQAYQAALATEPDSVDVWCNLGLAFHAQEKFDDAIGSFQRALALDPNRAQTHVMLADVQKEHGQIDESIRSYRRAIELAPRLAEAHNNLGTMFELEGKLDEACACYRQAVEVQPDFVEGHWNQSVMMLLRGEFERGWDEYEWRWKRLPSRDYKRPRWEGESVAGKSVLLHAEQGLGDTIQFVRYAAMAKRLGATVIVECQKPLMRLLATCPGIDQLIGYGEELPEFDFFVPLLSLPRIFKTTVDTIPTEVRYLSADATLTVKWREKLEGVAGFRIGINWHGRTGVRQSQKRDVPLEFFDSLAQIPGVRLISLQKGDVRSALKDHPMILDLGEFDTASGAFMDSAAIMMNLDLVITSDTSVPHLAGALGVPVWVALPFVPDWRWLLDRSDSPWYPTMRLFRQKKPGDWAGAFEEIEIALRERVKSEG